ncbi:MAG: helix-turn-helix domain-containing protein [Pyrinomonadaceae bacterium]
MLTTKQAAEKLGVTPGRVRQMVADKVLPVIRIGRDNLIRASDLKLVEDRKPGRPPKAKAEPSKASKRGGR